MGILIFAMLVSGPIAIAAMIAGHSVWVALAIYSGGGVATALTLATILVVGSALKAGRPPHKQASRADVSA